MTLATEIGEDVDVRVFEEVTFIKKNPDGNCRFYASMKPKLNLLTGGTIKVTRWERKFFYVKIDEETVSHLHRRLRDG